MRKSLAMFFSACAGSSPPPQAPAAPASAPAAAAVADEDAADLEFLTAYTETRRFGLGEPTRIELLPDGSQVLFLRAGPRKSSNDLFAFDVKTGQTRELVTAAKLLGGEKEKLGAEERARRERMRTITTGITAYDVARDGKSVAIALSGKVYVAAVTDGAAIEVAAHDDKDHPAFDARLAPDGRSVAFVRGDELWVVPAAGGPARQLTHGAGGDVKHAQAEFVAAEEMDRFEGYWWAPDSTALVYEIADAGKVEKYYAGDAADPMTPAVPTPYPRPGHANVDVSLAIVPVHGGRPLLIEWDRASYPYLANLTWGEGSPLTLTVLSRDQKDLSLLAVDPKTGKSRELLHEHDDAWVSLRPGRRGVFGDHYRWLRDGSGFLWTTERNGAAQLELRAPDGKLVRALTALGFGFRAVRRVMLEERGLVVQAAPEPVDARLWRIGLDGGEPQPMSDAAVVADAHYASDAGVYVLARHAAEARFEPEVHRADGSVAGVLGSVAEKSPIVPKVEIARLGPAPGFWTAIVRPRDFDPKRKYPVLVSVYGGPGVTVVHREAYGYLIDQFLANHGFIVVSVDNRGTPLRDRAWERAIHGKLAEVPLEDQVAGLHLLAQHEPAMDLGRVGIFGASYGGFMSALAVLRRPDVYKAGFASAPVTDWLEYDTAYTERYLGVPGPGDTKVYDENSLLADADKLTRPLLLVHGTADDNVHVEHTLKLVDRLFRAGKKFDLVTIAGQAHGIREPRLQFRYYQKMLRFFRDHV
jgi:dipeptidyl-peptidase-4